MTITRRTLLGSTLVAGASLVTPAGAQPAHQHGAPVPPTPPGAPVPSPDAAAAAEPSPTRAALAAAGGRVPGHRVAVPNGSVLPWTVRRGVKIFHLRAAALRHQIAPGLDIE